MRLTISWADAWAASPNVLVQAAMFGMDHLLGMSSSNAGCVG